VIKAVLWRFKYAAKVIPLRKMVIVLRICILFEYICGM